MTNPFDEFTDPTIEESGSPPGGRFAFTVAALALGFQTADLVLHLYTLFTADQQLFGFMRRPEYGWYVGTPITWGAAAASYMLLADAWRSPRRRPAFLLAAMNTFDLFLWLSEHAAEFNVSLPLAALRNPWLRQGVSVLQWFELLLFAGLAADSVRRLEGESSRTGLHGVRATALLGLMVWALGFALRSWLEFGPIHRLKGRVWAEIMLLNLFGMTLLAATAFQATLLCVLAARSLAQDRRSRRRAEEDDDLLRPQPDPFAEEDRRRRNDSNDPFGPEA